MIATVVIPIKTTNPLNGSQANWRGKAGRRKRERAATRLALLADARSLEGIGRCTRATFTRIAPSSGLDDDGLRASFKSVRDEVAAFLGVSDAPSGGVSWEYAQERGARGAYAVVVQIEIEADETSAIAPHDSGSSVGARSDLCVPPSAAPLLAPPIGAARALDLTKGPRRSRVLRKR